MLTMSTASLPTPPSVPAKRRRRNRRTNLTPPDKRRVKTGCLTCRSKHKKCDESKPVCNYCLSKGLECVWQGDHIRGQKTNTLRDYMAAQMSQQQQQQQQQLTQAHALPPGGADYGLQIGLQQMAPLQYQLKTPQAPQASSSLTGLSGIFGGGGGGSGGATSGQHTPDLLFDLDNFTSSVASTFTLQQAKTAPAKMPQFYQLSSVLPELMRAVCSVSGDPLPRSNSVTSSVSVASAETNPTTTTSGLGSDQTSLGKNATTLLLDYYREEVCVLLVPDDPDVRVFADRLTEMAEEFEPLKSGLLALSSRFLEQVSPEYDGRDTVTMYNKAVDELVTAFKDPYAPDFNTHSVSTMIVLWSFELVSVAPEQWSQRFDPYAVYLHSSMPKPSVGNLGVNDPIFHALQHRLTLLEAVVHAATNDFAVIIQDKAASSSFMQILGLIQQIETLQSNDKQQWQILWESVQRWKALLPASYRMPIEQDEPGFYLSSGALARFQLYHVAVYKLWSKVGNALYRYSSQQIIAAMKSNMRWKNRRSVGSLLVCFFSVMKLLDAGLDQDQAADLQEMIAEVEQWSGNILLSWLRTARFN